MGRKEQPALSDGIFINIPPIKEINPIEYNMGQWKQHKSQVIGEAPFTLNINGESWVTLMCTPVALEALAVGFLYNEQVIESVNEIASVRICPPGDNVDIWLLHQVEKPKTWARTSGCSGGVTGAVSTGVTKKEMRNGATISPAMVTKMLREFYQPQGLYTQTGGVHTSALSDGRLIIAIAEDIGRHNTLDKLAGMCILEDLHPSRIILLTTGRISSEMLQKTYRIGAPIIISRTSPSSRSIEMAENMGITLIGYARRDQFIIYSHPERIIAKIDIAEISQESHDQ
jgi:FdhD protein